MGVYVCVYVCVCVCVEPPCCVRLGPVRPSVHLLSLTAPQLCSLGFWAAGGGGGRSASHVTDRHMLTILAAFARLKNKTLFHANGHTSFVTATEAGV